MVRMESDFGITLPDLPDLADLDVRSFLNEVDELVRNRGWEVTPNIVIDVFSFHKEAMYRDLKDNEDAVKKFRVNPNAIVPHKKYRLSLQLPYPNLDSYYLQISWNYRDQYDFAPGGIFGGSRSVTIGRSTKTCRNR